jgi:hypothetical protein
MQNWRNRPDRPARKAVLARSYAMDAMEPIGPGTVATRVSRGEFRVFDLQSAGILREARGE